MEEILPKVVKKAAELSGKYFLDHPVADTSGK